MASCEVDSFKPRPQKNYINAPGICFFFFLEMPLPKVFKVLKLQSQSGESPASPAKPSASVGVTLVKMNPLSGRTDAHSVPSRAASNHKPVPPGGKNIFQHFFFDLLQL